MFELLRSDQSSELTMLLSIAEFRERIERNMDGLVADLQELTHRRTPEEADAWRKSLPGISRAFSAPSFSSLDLYFGEVGNLSLEYKLPAMPSWADMVLLGRHGECPAAVIVELKHWITQGDLPGPVEGLMERHGQVKGHPSDQVRGYVEQCRSFHSAIHERNASVHGCVVFTRDPYYHTYGLPPNKALTDEYPCFSLEKEDVSARLPDFFASRLTAPDREFAETFEKGVYRQSRSFVRQVGEQILRRESSPFILLDNQRTAFALCRARTAQALSSRRPKKTVILVEGPPGSGKSIVAAKLWASLVTDPDRLEGNVVVATTSASQNSNWCYLFELASGLHGASGAIVKATGYTPLSTQRFGSLREKYPTAFKPESQWRDNLAMLRAIDPNFRSGSKDNEFLVSIVDEAHALINPEHSDGRGQFGFTTALGPQAYHIIRSSLVCLFLFDPRQGFRDRENTTVDDIKKWSVELGVEVVEEISLAGSQFRCAGSNEYTQWVDRMLGFTPAAIDDVNGEQGGHAAAKTSVSKVKRFLPFELGIFETPADLETALRAAMAGGNTVRLLASYARQWRTERVALPHNLPAHLMDFNIPYYSGTEMHIWSKVWNYVPRGSDYTHFIQAPTGSKMHGDPLCEVGCPYALRVFDFDYVGILWLSDLKWTDGGWRTDPAHVFERGISRTISRAAAEGNCDGPAHEALLRAVREAYRINLTRPMKGIFFWFEDSETRKHLECAIGRRDVVND
jgi:hypothetical protein